MRLLCGVVVLAVGLIVWLRSSQDLPQVALDDGKPADQETPASPTPSTSIPLEPIQQQTRDSVTTESSVAVVSAGGSPIDGAEVFFTPRIDRTVRKSERRLLGSTSSNGKLQIPHQGELKHPTGHLAARASGYLPNSCAWSAREGCSYQIVLSPASEQIVRCTDLSGEPVQGIIVLLSRFGVPPDLGSDQVNPDLEAGFDSTHAILTRVTDESGHARFDELRPGRYSYAIRSEYFEDLNKGAHWFDVPSPVLDLRVTPLLCGILQVVGDEMYTYSVTTNAQEWMPSTGMQRSRAALTKRLQTRYPESVVYVTGHTLDAVPSWSVTVELLLARTGKRLVELPLLPAVVDPDPLLVQVDAGAGGPNTVSTVSFIIRDRTARALSISHFDVYKEKSVLPLSRRITSSVPLRLPYGRWSIDTQYNILQGHYEPRTFELSQPDAEVEIRLDIDLVPVKVLALGYRGEAQTLGNLEFFQFGRRGSSGGDALDRVVLWMRPGETEWYFGTDSIYKTVERSIPVLEAPDGAIQTIQLPLELDRGR